MRFMLMALTLVALSLVTVAPALAHAGDDCPHHEATMQALRACVLHASEQGHIDNAGITQSLLAMLDAAQAAVEKRAPATAVHVLKAFTQTIEAQAGKHIALEHAGHLIEHAQSVIQALNG